MQKPKADSLLARASSLAGAAFGEKPMPTSAESAALDILCKAQPAWSETGPKERAVVAKELLAAIAADQWSDAGDWPAKEVELLRMSGGDDGRATGSAQRFVFGSIVKDFLSTFVASTEGKGLPQLDDAIDGSKRHGVSLGMSAPGWSGELWAANANVDPTPSTNEATSKLCCELRCAEGKATLALGAGNQSFLTLVGALDRLLVHGEAVLIKHHPLRPWLLPAYAVLLAPLEARGLVAQTLDRGHAATQALVTDSRVGHVCLTGSEATAAAVRGALDRAGRTEVGLTAELGCATPVLLAGGAWTDVELEHAAMTVAAAKKANGGCNCLSPQAVLLPRGWAHAAAFRAALERQLRTQPTQPAYYPGAAERRAACAARYGDRAAAVAGAPRKGAADDADEVLLVACGAAAGGSFDGDVLRREAFGAVLALVELGDDDAAAARADYLTAVAAPFANSAACAGCLSCSLLIPASAAGSADVEGCVAALRYGCVAVNGWAVLGYIAACRGGTWGAHPHGGPRSGSGVVGNAHGVPRPLKTVLRGPPLTTKPLIDGSRPPPPLVFDALHALVSAPSLPRGLGRVWLLLAVRAVQGALVAARLLQWPRRLFGAAV